MNGKGFISGQVALGLSESKQLLECAAIIILGTRPDFQSVEPMLDFICCDVVNTARECAGETVQARPSVFKMSLAYAFQFLCGQQLVHDFWYGF